MNANPLKKILTGLLLLTFFASGAWGADSFADIQTRGTVRIGVCDFAPWTFTNRAGQLEGFEIDVGRQIAADLGVTAEFKAYSLEEVFAAVDRGEIDFISAGLAITPARARRIEFSNPYFESGTTIVTNRQLAPNVRHAEDLNKAGFVVAIVTETFSAGLAAQIYDVATVKSFTDATTAEAELKAGRIHGYLTSVPEARMLAKRYPESIDLPLSAPLIGSVAGFGVKRGNQALLNYLNAWIASRLVDRFLGSSYNYWFSGYDWLAHTKNDGPTSLQPAN